MSPAAKMPGMLVSMSCETLMSCFSSSSPHSAMAPSEETKPSCGSTTSIASVSSSFVLLLTMVTRSTRASPWIPFSSPKVRSSIFPAAHTRRTCEPLALQARHGLAQVDPRLPLQRLLGKAPHQVLGEDLGDARDVEDVLLGVERGQLAARLIERVDQAERGPAHPGIEARKEAGGAGADDGDIFDVLHGGERNGRPQAWGVGCGTAVKIYTKKGDGGDTGLFGGERVPKDDARVEAYGQVDELNEIGRAHV